MQNLKRNKNITFRVSEQEYGMIYKRMAQTGVRNLRAYLLKMAIDGQIIEIEMESVKECSRLLSSIANNVNQLARKANSGGNVDAAGLSGLKQSLDRVFEQQNIVAARLAKAAGNT